MTNPSSITRRNFMKSSAVASTALLGASALSACAVPTGNKRKPGQLPENSIKNYSPSEGISGLLFSQIGYELGLPVRIVIRLPKKELLQGQTTCKLISVSGGRNYETEFNYHSQIWGSHWWVADFRNIEEAGEWDIEVIHGNECVFSDQELIVGKNIL